MGQRRQNTARTTPLRNQFTTLRYANQTARLYGVDLSRQLPLADAAWGEFGLKGLLSYVRGKTYRRLATICTTSSR